MEHNGRDLFAHRIDRVARDEATLGVRNLDEMRLAEKSALFTQVEAPRTWRLTLLGRR